MKKKRKKGKTINHSQKREKRDLRQSDVNSTIEKKREKVEEENMKKDMRIGDTCVDEEKTQEREKKEEECAKKK